MKYSWITRNRILKPTGGWQYITVPVEKSSFRDSYRTPIMDVEICAREDWRGLIIRQLDHYRRKAPYFSETVNLVKSCLDSEERSIARLNVSILEQVCGALGIEFNYSYSSEMDFARDPSLKKLDKAAAIYHSLGASKYINLPGGRDLYGEQPFRERGMEVEFRNLPALDVLMWIAPAKVKEHLEMHR
jgi:hypothetical protein